MYFAILITTIVWEKKCDEKTLYRAEEKRKKVKVFCVAGDEPKQTKIRPGYRERERERRFIYVVHGVGQQ